jgi:hypothetical protein
MTAVIGILNKNAVAIAADSAVTVSGSNGSKIYNTANKIFTLSKFHPVSVTIYNSANFITTPWEIIIKMYRKELGERSFPRLRDYSDDFFRFLKTNNFFSSTEVINHFFRSLIFFSIEDFVRKSYETAMMEENDLILLSKEKRLEVFRKYIIDLIEKETEKAQNCEQLEDFKTLSKKEFNTLTKKDINEIFEENYKELSNKNLKDKYSSFLFNYIKSKLFYGQWSGLVFAGYGDDEIYPTTISTKIASVFDNKIRFYTDVVESINDNNTGSIMPFAQRDVIDTLITGISPDINETLFSTFNNILSGYNQYLINLVSTENPKLAKALSKLDIDKVCEEFVDEINKVKEIKHIEPTVNTVSILSKEDLAEMAESLIYLTYLKRRISSHEESVGGPVDVAIISKGDGFIWIKRKHYFEEKYNPQFNYKYFNS